MVEHDGSGVSQWTNVLDKIVVFVGLLTPDGILLQTNEAPLAIAGIRREDVIGKPFWDCYWWAWSTEVQEQLKESVRRAAEGITIRYDVDVRIAGDRLITIDFQLAPLRDESGRITHIVPSGVDISRRKRAEEELRESESRYRAIIDTAVDAIVVIDEQGSIQAFNAAAERMFGYSADEVLGRNVNFLMPEPYRSAHDGYLRNYRVTGAAKIIGIGREVEARRSDGSTFPVDLAVAEWKAGGQRHFTGILRDITERRRSEERLKLLAREVDHRARNILTVVQAVVRMTKAPTVADYVEAVSGRIAALARVHSLLAKGRWEKADLRSVIEDELVCYGGNGTKFELLGHDLDLPAAAAQPLAMVVHELATNSAKYGALSSPRGSVSVTWSEGPVGRLRIEWSEAGGPPTLPPTRHGFGLEMITQMVERQLQGEVRLEWQLEGLRLQIDLPSETGGA